MQELFADKIHFFKFISTSGKPWLDRLKIFTVASINSRCLLLAKDMIFGKQTFDVKQLNINKFRSDVKQSTMNKLISDVKQFKKPI